MDAYLKEAIGLVRAQASVRVMNRAEITSMIKILAVDIKSIAEGGQNKEGIEFAVDPKKAIRDKSILCTICGKSFKQLTQIHMSSHGLTSDEYREKCGYKKDTPLACHSLRKGRKKRMEELKLWERKI